MNHSGGIFYAKPVGYFDNIDGKMWSNAVKKYANDNYASVGLVIDMTEVDRVCPTLVKVFAEIAKLDNMTASAIVIDPNMYSRNSRVIDKIAQYRNVQVFHTMLDAEDFVDSRLATGATPFATFSTSNFAFGAF